MADPLCSTVSGVVGDSEIVRVSIPCVLGVHVAGVTALPAEPG